MNRPENTLPWEVHSCEWNEQWWTVGYILRGPKSGTFVPCHHWADKRDADAHVNYLNRGFTRDDAHAMAMALVHRAEPE